MTDDDEIRVLTANIEHDGRDRDGSTTRWHKAMKVMAAVSPHVLLRQELTRADLHGKQAMWDQANALGNGFFPFMATASKESANPTGVFLDTSVFQPIQEFEHSTLLWHPVCNPVVRLKGALPEVKPLSLASAHLCYWDPDTRAREARRLTTLGKPGMETIIGGDFNSYVHAADEAPSLPDWDEVDNRSHVEHRTVIGPNGVRVSDTRPDAILAGRHGTRPPVFAELGQHAVRLGQSRTTALAPTASLWRKDQGPRQRIDRIYATPGIADALVRIEVLDSDEVAEATDHALVLAVFRWSKVVQALSGPAVTP
ncbi:endonuclease/exonuclease/phosphatase family protein [Streptomyces aureocirculatus]|uniref:endonuclease/exonuclease/phosphatase family protein n=1 Tax=Streptomyces aureocirculatus TaxID=67275 RepID=UPI0004CBC61F|nr:endonuclease/exonuclease/phosphatase family protein [Streptomyces aureocirculatus]